MIGRDGIIRVRRALLLLTGLSMLAGCMPEPYLPGYTYRMATPMPPPLQPYVEPVVPPATVVTTTIRTTKRRYVRRHRYHQARCPCRQVQ